MESTGIPILDFAGFSEMTEIERIRLVEDKSVINAFGCTVSIELLDCRRSSGPSEDYVLVLEITVRERGIIYWEYDSQKGYETSQGRGFALREIAAEICREFDPDILALSRKLGSRIPWTRCRIELVHALKKAGWFYESPC